MHPVYFQINKEATTKSQKQEKLLNGEIILF